MTETTHANAKSPMRKKLEQLKDGIYKGWIQNIDKVSELIEISTILENILSVKNKIEEAFESKEDFDFFIGDFSKETIENLLRQWSVLGNNGDDEALRVLVNYLKIFLKFIDSAQAQPLWEYIIDIFDNTKSFYKGVGAYSMEKETNEKRKMTAEQYNSALLPKRTQSSIKIVEGMEIDVMIPNKKRTSNMNPETHFWVRGVVCKVYDDVFHVKTSEEIMPLVMSYNTFDYAPARTMTPDWEWKQTLGVYDNIDCYGRYKWTPATVVGRKADVINEILRVEYRISFRLFTNNVANWADYTQFFRGKPLTKDYQQREYLGESDYFDETLPFFSKRIKQLNSMTTAEGDNTSFESETYIVDKEIKYIDDYGKKTHVVGRSSNFTYYYVTMLTQFAEMNGIHKLLTYLCKKGDERPNADLIRIIFHILNAAGNFFHKDLVIEIGNFLYVNIFTYLNEMSLNELRNMKTEALEQINKVLKFYLGHSLGVKERNEVIEKFSIAFSVRLIKTNFLDKRISAIKTIVDVIRSAKSDPQKKKMILDLVEENRIFHEIYGPNSHIQLIKKSKELLEIIVEEDKLSDTEMEMIWDSTKKGDLESKLTILRTLKEISKALKPKHIKTLLDNIYSTVSADMLDEEIELIYELSLCMGGDETLDKCIKFFTQCLLESRTDEGERIDILVNKIFDVTKDHLRFRNSVLTLTLESLTKNENIVLALKIFQKFLRETNLETDLSMNQLLIANDILVNRYIKNFIEYLTFVKEKVKNWTQDIDQLNLRDHFNHSQNIKARLNFLNCLLDLKIWKSDIDPVDFVYKSLIEGGVISVKDEQQFYSWIKTAIERKCDYETEEKIFKLFNEKICKDSKCCMSMSIEAFDAYLRVFLDINMHNGNLKYTKLDMQKSYNIEVYKFPEELIGFDMLWKIIFESFSQDIMNKGIEILHLMFTNIQIMDMTQSTSQLLIVKCINLIKDVVRNPSMEFKTNVITKCLLILKLMIEEGERRGTAGIISHDGLLKKRMMTLKVSSAVGIVTERNFTLKLYGNTTIWDMKRIIAIKLKYSFDFLSIFYGKGDGKTSCELVDSDNGKTLIDMHIENGDEIYLQSNGMEKTIPQVELQENGVVLPVVVDIFHEWFTRYSTNNQMTKEDCARFVQVVCGHKDTVTIDDQRVANLFSTRDSNKDNLIEREDFVAFYSAAAVDCPKIVWDNLAQMCIRHDLKRMSEPYLFYNENPISLPRYQLSANEEFFNVIFNLQDINEDIAKESYKFLCILATNPKLYNQILQADASSDWNVLLSDKNIYKLIYSLQIIESLIEDIEINSQKVDNVLLESKENITEMTKRKQEWMKNFIERKGFQHLVLILRKKLQEFIETLTDTSTTLPPMTSQCIEFLLKIVKIFYLTSLSKFDSYKKAVNEYMEDKNCNTNTNENLLFRGTSFRRSSSINFHQLEDYFVSEGLSETILTSLDDNTTISSFLSCLARLILKGKSEQNVEIIQTIFEFISMMIPQSTHYVQVEAMILADKKFIDIILFGLLNPNDCTRALFSSSLIKMCKILQKSSRYDVISYLFQHLFKLIENISQELEKNSSELFEFFSFLFEMHTLHSKKFKKIFSIDSKSFLVKLLNNLSKDINEEDYSKSIALSDELFLGFLKIIAKVAENNIEIKQLISQKYNLIEGILTKVLFKKSAEEMKKKLSQLELIEPEKMDDSKSGRNSNEQIRNVCYRFILSMLKDSIENFEKFFSVGVLDEEKEKEVDTKNEYKYRNYYYYDSGKNEDHVGLKNLGCICYMNATMQQFYMISSLRNSILRVNDHVEPNMVQGVDDNLLHQVQKMFSYLNYSDRCDYNPYEFTYAFKDLEGGPTKTHEQKDAQEFLNFWLDRIEQQIKHTPGKYTIQSIFGAKTCSQVICQSCGYASSRYEEAPFLSVEVKNMKTLSDSFEKLICKEKIDEYSCDGCKQKTSITKSNSLFSLPNVLIVHLQRIFYNWEIDRNEKINSRLEFPRTLNLKQYTLEEITRKSGPKLDDDANVNVETDEIYFRHPSYYEYYLVGVIVHSGSADSGHYYSYINTQRGGHECEASYNPNDSTHTNSWLEFNDSRISKFSASNLEEECFGGSYDTEKSANEFSWNKGEKCKSAYMLVYERRIKHPLKVVIDPQEIKAGDDHHHMISFKADEYPKIKKEYDLLRYVGDTEMKKKIFTTVFFDVEKNEYFKYMPFYFEERLIPAKYFIEIAEDNANFRKQQNISDQRFATFFEEAIKLLDETVSNLKVITPDTAAKITSTFMNFLFNVLNKKDHITLLKSVKDKFIRIIQNQSTCLALVWEYIASHQKQIEEKIFASNEMICSIICEFIYELIAALYKFNSNKFIEESKKKANANDDGDGNIFSYCFKTVNLLYAHFPKVPVNELNNTGAIMSMFRQISLIDPHMLVFFSQKEFLFVFITFLLGKDSPCFDETISKPSENWDKARPVIGGSEPVLELMADIIERSTWYQSKTAVKQADQQYYIIELSDRDIKCLRSTKFLKHLYDYCPSVFSKLLVILSKDDYEFTVTSCEVIVKNLEGINYNYSYLTRNDELVKLTHSLIPLLALDDGYQQMRFEVLLGIPQLNMEDGGRVSFPLVGYHMLMDYNSQHTAILSPKGKEYTTLIKTLIGLKKNRKLEKMQAFLVLLDACLTNNALYKYLTLLPAEELKYENIIHWGIAYVIENDTNDKVFIPQLQLLVDKYNHLQQNIINDQRILPGFNGFIGRYLIKNFKRQEISLVHTKENVYVFQVEYLANIESISDNIDFSKSLAYIPGNASLFGDDEDKPVEEVIDPKENLTSVADNEILLYSDQKKKLAEKDFFNSLIPYFPSYKKVIVERKASAPGFMRLLKRYVILNGKLIISSYYIFHLASTKDVNVDVKFTRGMKIDEPNEYVPFSTISEKCFSYSIKTIYLMSKIFNDKDWTERINIEVKFDFPFEKYGGGRMINLNLDSNSFNHHPINSRGYGQEHTELAVFKESDEDNNINRVARNQDSYDDTGDI